MESLTTKIHELVKLAERILFFMNYFKKEYFKIRVTYGKMYPSVLKIRFNDVIQAVSILFVLSCLNLERKKEKTWQERLRAVFILMKEKN